ncbi:MAG TPA: hypothetical protein RMH99_17845 [Sandaracinaceae bacterium LLY-WYZ-13_1]|nr:hypothetical protein [Sandaracinaceae bacterium LLY-WYZ-13_1]
MTDPTLLRVPRPDEPRLPRRWEAALSRDEILYLLHHERHVDLLARLCEVRTHYPHDLELLRSIRLLEKHLRLTQRAA